MAAIRLRRSGRSLRHRRYVLAYVSCLFHVLCFLSTRNDNNNNNNIRVRKQKHENGVLLTEDSITGILLDHHLLLAMAAVSGGRLSGGYLALVIAASVVFLLASIAAVYTMVRSVYTTVYRHVSK